MDAVWIDRVWRDTVWSALHNIKINYNPWIVNPVICVGGEGMNAYISVDVPHGGTGFSNADDSTAKPFTLFWDDENRLMIKGGIITVGSSRFNVEDTYLGSGRSGIAYAEVIYDDGSESYSAGVHFDPELPSDSDPKRWYLRLASVSAEGDYSQIWGGGDLEVTGRWVK